MGNVREHVHVEEQTVVRGTTWKVVTVALSNAVSHSLKTVDDLKKQIVNIATTNNRIVINMLWTVHLFFLIMLKRNQAFQNRVLEDNLIMSTDNCHYRIYFLFESHFYTCAACCQGST